MTALLFEVNADFVDMLILPSTDLGQFQLRNRNQRMIPTPVQESELFGVNLVESESVSESFGVNLVESESESESSMPINCPCWVPAWTVDWH